MQLTANDNITATYHVTNTIPRVSIYPETRAYAEAPNNKTPTLAAVPLLARPHFYCTAMLTLTSHPGDNFPVLAPRAAANARASRLEPSSSAVLALRAMACAFDYRTGGGEAGGGGVWVQKASHCRGVGLMLSTALPVSGRETFVVSLNTPCVKKRVFPFQGFLKNEQEECIHNAFTLVLIHSLVGRSQRSSGG